MKELEALRIVEAANRVADGVEPWLAGIVASVAPLVERDVGVQASAFDIRKDGTAYHRTLVETPGTPTGWSAAASGYADAIPRECVPALYCDVPPIDTARGLAARRGVDAHPSFFPFETFGEWGIVDLIGIVVHDGHGAGFVLAAPSARVLPPFSAAEVRRWRFLRSHLLAGARLHHSLGAPDAILDASGRVVHARPCAQDRSARDALRHHARELDRARRARDDPERALAAWTALVEGRWSLVDRFDSDGRRFLVARRNDPVVPSPRALSERERQIAAYAGLGHSNKRIAYTLGLAPSTVSSHLQAAMRRLGARDPAALSDIFFTPPEDEDEPS